MATSGSKNFSLTRNDIINAALRKIGEYDKGETPSGDETADASEALNVLVNEYAGVHGADIFLRQTFTLFVQKGQESYSIGGGDANEMADSYVVTAISAPGEASAQTTLTVDDATGMTVGDIIGIELDNGSIDWSTITVIAGSDVTIALSGGLTDAAATGKAVYTFTTTGSTLDHATESYVETALDGALVTADIRVVVDSTTGMTAGDFIGIKLATGAIHWTNIVVVDSSTQVTIYTGLPSAASDNAKVYTYTTKAYRPHKLLTVYRRAPSGLDNEITKIGEIEYARLTDKDSEGVPNTVHYRSSLNSGTLYVWPVGDGDTDKIVIIAHYYPDDFDVASDTAQFPIEWSSALIWGLAAELSPEYGLPEREQRKNFQIASAKLTAALDADIEDASVIFGRA